MPEPAELPDPLPPEGLPPVDAANPVHQEAQRAAQAAGGGPDMSGMADVAGGAVEAVVEGGLEVGGEVLGGAFEALGSGAEVVGGCAEGCSFLLAVAALLALTGSALAYTLRG